MEIIFYDTWYSLSAETPVRYVLRSNQIHNSSLSRDLHTNECLVIDEYNSSLSWDVHINESLVFDECNVAFS